MIAAGTPLPEVTVEDGGTAVPLAEVVTGTPTLLVFEKASCPTCRIAMPVYDAWRVSYGPGVRVVAVSQDDPEVTREFFDEIGVEITAVTDPPPHPASAAFDLTSVPTLALVVDGVVTHIVEGWHKERDQRLAADLAERVGAPVAFPADDLPPFKPG